VIFVKSRALIRNINNLCPGIIASGGIQPAIAICYTVDCDYTVALNFSMKAWTIVLVPSTDEHRMACRSWYGW